MLTEMDLWRKRRSEYWTMAMKYLKMLGNSGFMFTLYILLVFGGYYYGQLLDWLPEAFPTAIFFTVIFSWLMTRGRVRTFIKQGDLFFLTAREGKMTAYFQASLRYSWVMELIWASLAMFLLSPLFFDRISSSATMLFSVLLLLFALKLWNLAAGFEEQRIQDQRSFKLHTLLRFALNAVTVYGIFSLQPIWLIAILAVILIILYLGYYKPLSRSNSLKWERLLDIEDQTVMAFYRMANSFTDVPALKSKVERRNWLSALFKLVAYKKDHVFHYLYIRAFTRANDYFGIYARLTLLAVLFISIIQLDWGRWLVALVFAYMSALQLETLKQYYSTSNMADLYPISQKERLNSHRFWLLRLGILQGLIFSLTALLSHGFMDAVTVLVFILATYVVHASVRLPKVYETS